MSLLKFGNDDENTEALLNQDNTLLNSIEFEELTTSPIARKDKTLKTQKFPTLSLNKTKSKSPRKVPSLKRFNENTPEVKPHKIINRGKLSQDRFALRDNTCSFSSNETENIQPQNSQSLTSTKFHSYLNKDTNMSLLTQFFTNSQVMNQIDSAIAMENQSNETFKKPQPPAKPAQKENVADTATFQDRNRQEFEQFFNEVEHSISMLGEGVENNFDKMKDVIEALFMENDNLVNPDKNLPSSQTMQNIDWNDTSLVNASNLSINASFGTTLRKVLLANVSKDLIVGKSLNNASMTRNKVDFRSMGPYYGLPLKVKELIKLFKGIDELYDWQDECLNLPAIKNRKNLIYALPTSGGKTLVAEILMLRELICYKRNALFILPFVAIVQEKVWSLSPFAVALDFLVEEYAASKGTYPPRKRRRKNSIYIATIEKALGLLNSLIETERLNEIGLIVVDELHLVGEQGRGSTLEALLTKILLTKADIQIVGMSATIGNVKDLCQFLNAEIYTQNFRPVELTEYVKCGVEVAKVNWSSKEEELLSVVRKTNYGYSEGMNSIDPDMLGGLVMEVIPNGSCLIFCSTKKNCENVAYLLCRVVDKKLMDYKTEEKINIKNALKDESGSLCKIFRISIKFGIAYHHSGLTNEERRVIEDAFRAGIISVICCTSTLAAGVNLPAKRVILRQPYVGRDFISLSKYKQMVGRAGRAGLGEAGDSILICTPKELPKVKTLLMSPMDQALSNMHEADGKGLRHLLLSCINLGIANTRLQLQSVSKKTLMQIQSDTLEINVKKLTDKVLSDLFKLGALQEADLTKPENNGLADVTVAMETSVANISTPQVNENPEEPVIKKKRKIVIKNDTKLVISKLGCAAIKGGFDLTRAHMLYDDLHQAQKSLVLLDSLHLLYLVTPYEIADQVRPNKNDYYNIYCKLKPNELQTARVLGLDDAVATKMLSNQKIKTVPERTLNRFFLTLMLYDLWNGTPVFEVSDKFQVNRGVVQNLMTGASTFASNVVNFCEGLEEFWTFAHLLKGMSQRLSHCCTRELLPLMELPAVKQSRAKQLYNAGFKNLQSIAKSNAEALVEKIEFLPLRVAKQLIAAAKMLLLEKVENLREEAEDVLDGVENQKVVSN